jgi:hypothetical protein
MFRSFQWKCVWSLWAPSSAACWGAPASLLILRARFKISKRLLSGVLLRSKLL